MWLHSVFAQVRVSAYLAALQINLLRNHNFPFMANLVFVFDDGGQNLYDLQKFLELPFPITIAVLPKLKYSAESAKRVRNSGHELILHQPMQAINRSVNPGPGAITPEMTEEEVRKMLLSNINEIGPIAGMNNHEGSAITADIAKMEVILKTASDCGIFFLDSRTNVKTVVPLVAKEMGYNYYERNIFLDNEKFMDDFRSFFKVYARILACRRWGNGRWRPFCCQPCSYRARSDRST